MSEEMQFKVKYCGLCACDMIICPKCGNNCCNGGSGEVDGEKCDVCLLAYQYQDLYWERQLSVLTTFFLRDGQMEVPPWTIDDYLASDSWKYWKEKCAPNSEYEIKKAFYEIWDGARVKGRFITIEICIGRDEAYERFKCPEYYVKVREAKNEPLDLAEQHKKKQLEEQKAVDEFFGGKKG